MEKDFKSFIAFKITISSFEFSNFSIISFNFSNKLFFSSFISNFLRNNEIAIEILYISSFLDNNIILFLISSSSQSLIWNISFKVNISPTISSSFFPFIVIRQSCKTFFSNDLTPLVKISFNLSNSLIVSSTQASSLTLYFSLFLLYIVQKNLLFLFRALLSALSL